MKALGEARSRRRLRSAAKSPSKQPRVAPIATVVSGRVWHVTEKGRIGETVQRGDVLALIDAADVGKAKAEFLQAFAQLELKTKTLENLKPLGRPREPIPLR